MDIWFYCLHLFSLSQYFEAELILVKYLNPGLKRSILHRRKYYYFSESTIFILNFTTSSISSIVRGIKGLIDVCTSDQEILLLCSDRSIRRISQFEDKLLGKCWPHWKSIIDNNYQLRYWIEFYHHIIKEYVYKIPSIKSWPFRFLHLVQKLIPSINTSKDTTHFEVLFCVSLKSI